ncbi:MAG: hypothetical protein PHU49_03490 [Syntrophorhabdaceae bacterium]|nr:hypothetical protein [Syntrophorhabdaceae bacterium]MDD5243058.1 hypothetical protein [Syntrophorhabdaceae bacterium]
MKIDNWEKSPYNDSEIIKKHEKHTFAFLSSNPMIKTKFSQLSHDAKLQYDALSVTKKAKVHNIDFQSSFEVTCLNRDLRIHIGAIIKNDFSHVTYYLAVFSKNKRGKYIIRRKFHFDYDKKDSLNVKPRFHMQYAGKLTSALSGPEDYYDAMFFPELSEPRMYSTPMTLAILLSKVFKEFQCVDTHKIVEDPNWKSILAEHEKIFLKPYFEWCGTFFKVHHKASRLFTTDFCYGK